VGWLTEPGKQFFTFAQGLYRRRQARRLAGRTRKRCRPPAVVFALVVVMAIFLALVDGVLAWAMKFVMGTLRIDGS
jgi:uncharacterized membrane protein YjdF